MKTKLLITFILFVAATAVKAQPSNAILFAENGERFQVVLNGVLQNASPETNVKLTGLNAPNYKARILFQDKTLGMVDFNLFFPNPEMEVTWNIKKNKKGEYVVRGVSEVEIAQAPPSPATQTVVIYSATPPPVETTTTTVRQTTTTTNSVPNNGDNVNINMGVNMNDQGGNMNINISGMDASGTSTTTTTTTRSTTIVNSDNTPPPTRVIYVEGYNGTIGCPMPMNRHDFESFKSSVSSKSFEESKLTIAKQVLNNNCLTSSEVRETMKLFTFENTKLDFAKYAYGHTYDVNNYYKVNDAFQFESSISELNDYISQQR